MFDAPFSVPLETSRDPSFIRGGIMAEEAICFLEKAKVLPSKSKRRKNGWSADIDVLFELSAAIRLNAWLEAGLCDYFPDQTAETLAAMEASLDRLSSDPEAYAGSDGLPPLSEKVYEIWRTYFAWSGLEDVGADVLLQATEDDANAVLLEFAGLLWDCIEDVRPEGS